MNLQDLNQVTTPEAWTARALEAQGVPAPVKGRPKKKLVLAVAVTLISCVIVCGAAFGYHQYLNGTIAKNLDTVKTEEWETGYQMITSDSPISREAIPLERFLADHVATEETWKDEAAVAGQALFGESSCTSLSVTADKGPLWVRQLFDDAGHVKTEETAQGPLLLTHWQSDAFSWDLTWLSRRYHSPAYGNLASVTRNEQGDLLASSIRALYTGEDNLYFSLEGDFSTEHRECGESFLFEAEYDAIVHHTDSNGIPWTLTQAGNQIWATSLSPHLSLSLYAANMDFAAVQEILDHLDLQVVLAPEECAQES